MYPRVLDINNNLVAVLQNAYKIGYTKIKNNLWTCQFTLPLNDKKNEHVQPKYFIELYDHDRYIGKFIVNPKRTIKNESTNEITYHCEHVLSTLHSDVLFRYHQFSNFTTQEVLEALLEQQEVKHWTLGTVAFTRFFHYAWENEDSLLNAIMSVPKPFDVPYLWTWDDSVYPFVLNLVEPPTTPVDVIAAGKNLKGIEVEEDPTNIVTRIYPLGAGEGVNQLDITDVNNGVPYLQDDEAIAKYGVHKRVWVDRRFEHAESLKASAQAILDKYKKPIKSIAIDCRDYTLYERQRKRELMALYDVGDVLLVHDQDTNTHEEIRLEKIAKNDIYGAPQDIQLELGSLVEDVSTTFTDLQKKQLVNETYSQGATNIMSFNYQDNCDSNIPAVIPFYIDDDVVNINTCELTFRTRRFRAYSRTTEGGGGVVTSTKDGGGTTATSSSGGGVSTSTASGGGSQETTSGGGLHDHRMFSFIDDIPGTDPNFNPKKFRAKASVGGNLQINLETVSADVITDQAAGTHSHTVNLPSHTHNFEVPSHRHNVTIPDHSHEIEIPDHIHDVKHEIVELDETASRVTIQVDGNAVPHTSTSGDRIDLTDYMQKDQSGKVTRGRHEVTISPNSLARVEADLILRVFIRSHLGGQF